MSDKQEKFEFTIAGDDAGKRFDVYLSERFEDRSRSSLKKVIDEAGALVNSGQVRSSYKLREGETVSVEFSPEGRS